MQDRYAGDIGDYGKLGLLRIFEREGFSIGVNWYKTQPLASETYEDGSFKHQDGRHIIPVNISDCDPELAARLSDIFEGRHRYGRSIRALEYEALIPGAVYYSEDMSAAERDMWHKKAMLALSGCRLVFLDPDNGMEVSSVRYHSAKISKYVLYEEAADYIRTGEQSLVIYNHRPRKKEAAYFEELRSKFQTMTEFQDKKMWAVTFPKSSVRDYIIIAANEEHAETIERALSVMRNSKWHEKRVCRIRQLSGGDIDLINT